MREPSSYRSIVRSTGIIGASQLGVLVIGLMRAKLLALLVGPAGIGLFGLYNTIVTTGAAVTGMGINTSAVRQIANPDDEPRTVRHAVWTLALLLAGVGGAAVWLLRGPLSRMIAGDSSLRGAIGWLALGVAFSVITAAGLAILQGMRRLGDLARVNVIGAALGTAAAIGFVYVWRSSGILAAAIAGPAGLLLASLLVLRRLRPAEGRKPSRDQLVGQWKPMLHLGSGVMATALIGAFTQLALRTLTLRALGLEAVGFLQAAIAITSINIGLVLSAMAADYYPRLAEAGDHRARLREIVDHQLHVAILLAAPMLLAISAGAVIWMQLLYSSQFIEAAGLLRWLVVAETIRLFHWAIAFLPLARKDTRVYVASEAAFSITALPIIALMLPSLGLTAIGVGYTIGYLVAFLFTSALVWRRQGIRISSRSARLGLAFSLPIFLLALFGSEYPASAMGIGLFAAGLAALFAVLQLHRQNALPGRLQPYVSLVLRRLGPKRGQ